MSENYYKRKYLKYKTKYLYGGSKCANGCGRNAYKHYRTCCTHCNGTFASHARDCAKKNNFTIRECINGCGVNAFGNYSTCCTHCIKNGPHAHDCISKNGMAKKNIKSVDLIIIIKDKVLLQKRNHRLRYGAGMVSTPVEL